LPTGRIAGGAKLTELQFTGAVTVRVNVLVVCPPAFVALTVNVYVPTGYASVTSTPPVAGSPTSCPLKSGDVETWILVTSVGNESGVTVALPLN
jgi:hypothetical protein